MQNIRNFGLIFLTLTLGLLSSPSFAHEISPTIVSVTVNANHTSLNLEVEGNLEALISEIGGEHEDTAESPNAPLYDSLRALDPIDLTIELGRSLPKLRTAFNLVVDAEKLDLTFVKADVPQVGDTDLARLSKLHFSSPIPKGAKTIEWTLDDSYGASVFRLSVPEQERVTEWLQGGKTSRTLDIKAPLQLTFVEAVVDYVIIGFVHIVPKGMDHILFVLGLLLISPFLRPLLWQVTAFTLAHTITIALGIVGVITAPGSIVEPLIAASIILIALENIMTKSVAWWRIGVVFLFGLLHGLGFAGVLSEIGLPDNQFATSLISFNVGVEFGQLTVILIGLFGVCYWLRSHPRYDVWVKIPGSVLIAIVATYWFLERTVWA